MEPEEFWFWDVLEEISDVIEGAGGAGKEVIELALAKVKSIVDDTMDQLGDEEEEDEEDEEEFEDEDDDDDGGPEEPERVRADSD